MLGMEISFDDKALSAYNISVSKTFKNPEDALYHLLNNKPFKVEKINHVYIIIPLDRQVPKSNTETKPSEPHRQFVFTGTASGKKTEDTLIFILPETIITADEVRHKVDCNSYSITPDMRRGINNTEELLHKIPGIYFDKATNTLKVSDSKNILLLVDGIQQSQDHIKYMSPDRIHTVEVINGASGRFISDDYTAIINIILKKDYRGYDIYASNFSAVGLSGINNSKRLILNQPVIRMSYTYDKINFYATYSHNKENQDLPVSKNLIYRGVELISEMPENTPNDLYEHKNNTITAGVSYQITPTQTVGIQGDYVSGKTETNQIYTMERTDISNNDRRTIKNSTETATSDYTFVGTLYYQGQFSERFRLYSDFSYN